jgi:hypothetical protein
VLHVLPISSNNYFIILYVKDKEVQTGLSPSPEEYDLQEENFIHMSFCRDPSEVSPRKLSLKQDVQKELSNQHYAPQKGESPMQSPTLQYGHPKSYGYKKTEVYYPGKAKRLKVSSKCLVVRTNKMS